MYPDFYFEINSSFVLLTTHAVAFFLGGAVGAFLFGGGRRCPRSD